MNGRWLSGRSGRNRWRMGGGRVAVRRLRVESLEERRLLAAAGGAVSSLVTDQNEAIASLIVQFRPGTSGPSSLAAYSAGNQLGAEWALVPGMRQVLLHSDTDIGEALAAYGSDPHVLFAEPDDRVRLEMSPNDPSFASDQWNLHNVGQTGGTAGADIRAPEAWDITLGDPSIIVAVIDSGVDYTHPDLAPNMWTNPGEFPGNGIDDDRNGFVDDIHGYDFANRDGNPLDDYYHGTHVAGTIAAAANNGVGIAGVAPNVRIMALKAFDAAGAGLISDAIAALNYAVANGATISNNSWGDYSFSAALKAAIQNAAGRGHVFVASAGNQANLNDTTPFYPANDNVYNVISVAATDANDHLAGFSNFGKQSVDLGAPGVNIYSTLPTYATAAMNDEGLAVDYGLMSGTSAAAPHVTGVVALVRSLHPDWSVQQIVQQVLLSVDAIPGLTSTTVTGGRLNAAAAVGTPLIEPLPPDPNPPYIIESDPAGVLVGPVDHVRLTFSKPIDPITFDTSDIISFTGPDGPIAVLGVNWVLTNIRQFDVIFDPQTSHGTYTLVIGPHIRDFAGNELDQNGDSLTGQRPQDEYAASFSIVGGPLYHAPDVPAAIGHIAQPTQLNSHLTIDQDVPVTDLKVRVDITFPRTGDLQLVLVAPNGNVAFLSAFNGGAGADYQDTVFDDWSTTLIENGSAPFTGSFLPASPLRTLFMASGLGTWTLVIQNWSPSAFTGTLNSWSLELNPDRPPPTVNEPPVPTDDEFSTQEGEMLTLTQEDLLANDYDPEDDSLVVIAVQNSTGGEAALHADGTITFWPEAGGGLGSFQYVVSDGFNTAIGNVTVHVDPLFQAHNALMSADVDSDGQVAARDALLIINRLNAFGSTAAQATLSGSAARLYFDVVPDNVIAPNDALAVINEVNSRLARAASGDVDAAVAASQSARAIAAMDDDQLLDSAAVDQLFLAGDADQRRHNSRLRVNRIPFGAVVR